MKFKITSLLLLSSTFAFSGIVDFFTRDTQSWAFVQSVGGMKVSAEGRFLHVDCNVTGMKKVTVKPTTVNSALGIQKIKHKLVGQTIQLRLVTGLISKKVQPTIPPLDLSAYPAGEYSVEYLSTDGKTYPLGKIKLSEEKKITQ